ncbi:hypothetical protein HYV85_00750 [Candidatus Woesearchaeota archaeon]|nr:hypothetical protein [Candidatus Woesearchaeota archaeon]
MKSSVFVKIDRYREIYDVINQIKSKLDEAKQLLRKVNELKGQEDAELASWKSELETVEKKLSTITEAMTKP